MATGGAKGPKIAGHRVEYNGVKFGGTDTTHHLMPAEYSLIGTPVYDDAGRTVIYTAYTLVVATHTYQPAGVAATTATKDTNSNNLRRLLKEENKPLVIKGMGLGDDDSINDVVWGPKPRLISLRSIGGPFAQELIWQVEFHLKPCKSGRASGQFLAFNWRSGFSFDNEGLLTHTVSGYYEIPRNARVIPADAVANPAVQIAISDQRREDFLVEVPVGFRRIFQNYDHNAAKTRTDFRVVDQQFSGHAFPVGISNATGSYDFQTVNESFQQHIATLTMMLTVQPGFPRSTAGFFFLRAALKKAAELNDQSAVDAQGGEARGTKSVVIPTSFRATELLFERTTIFSMTFQVTSSLSELLAFTQMWRPLGDQTGGREDYVKWQAARDAHNLDHPRGFSQLADDPSEDTIVNLCSPHTKINGSPAKIGTLVTQGDTEEQFPSQRFGCPEDIDKDNSWLSTSWKVSVIPEQQTSTFALAIENVIKTVRELIEEGATGDNLLDVIGVKTKIRGSKAKGGQVIEYHGEHSTKVLSQFMGFRMKYAWQFPVLREYGGVQLIPLGSPVVEVTSHACVLGCSVQFGRGYQLYETVNGESIDEFEIPDTPNTECEPVQP